MNDILGIAKIKFRQRHPIDGEGPARRPAVLVDGFGDVHGGCVLREEGVGGGAVVVGEGEGFLAFGLGRLWFNSKRRRHFLIF